MSTQPALFNAPATTRKPSQQMPEWLRNHLEITTGGFRRTATWTHCPKCNALVLQGLDNDRCAFRTTADPTPLTPPQETLCHIAGRLTFHATRRGKTITLDQRDHLDIGKPARTAIIPAHKCGARFNTFLITKPKESHHDHPPF